MVEGALSQVEGERGRGREGEREIERRGGESERERGREGERERQRKEDEASLGCGGMIGKGLLLHTGQRGYVHPR